MGRPCTIQKRTQTPSTCSRLDEMRTQPERLSILLELREHNEDEREVFLAVSSIPDVAPLFQGY
jgi:hypothetical protein